MHDLESISSPRIGFAREHARKAFQCCAHCFPEGFPNSLETAIQHVIPGYQLIPLSSLKEISAITIKDKKLIGYNTNHAPVRTRFSIAHEIGHIRVDHPDGVFDLQGNNPVFETEANTFAAEFLVPLHTLKAVFKSIRDPVKLAKYFLISKESMFYRLQEARLLKSIL